MTFTVERIKIEQSYNWELKQHIYLGEIRLTGETSVISLKVDDNLCREIIRLCADNIVQVATETANLMKTEIVEQVKQIEVKP